MRSQGPGFGDGDPGSLPWATIDPTSPYGALTIDQVLGTDAPAAGGSSGGVADLVREANSRTAALQNVDLGTALQSKLTGTFGQGAALPLAIMGLGLVAIALTPASGGRRR